MPGIVESTENVIAIKGHLPVSRDVGFRICSHLHAPNRRTKIEQSLQRLITIRTDVLRRNPVHRRSHPRLDIVLPNAEREIDTETRGGLRDVLQHLQIFAPLVRGHSSSLDLGERFQLKPKRIRRSEVVRLMRENQIKAIEAIASQHPEKREPIFAR